MKRVFLLCLILAFLCGCAPTTVGSVSSAPPTADVAGTASAVVPATNAVPVSDSASGINPAPIPALQNVSAGALGAMRWRCDGVTEGMYELWDSEEIKAALEALQSVQLLDKAAADETPPALEYELRLKNERAVHISFAADWVDFGDGHYYYRDFSNAGYPDAVYAVMVDNPAYGTSGSYEEADKDALMTALRTSPSPEPVSLSPEADDAITFRMTGTGYHYNLWFKAVRMGGTRYVFKRFFGLYVCLGEIGDDAHAQLENAKNGQFGTQRAFSVTSGGETILPPGLFVNSMTYHVDSGVFADAFPNIAEYTSALETVTLADDFAVWSKRQDKTQYRITGPDNVKLEGDQLTRSSFGGLPPGTYQVEVYVTTNGSYIEEMEQDEYTTDVYFFLVNIP